MKDSDTEIKPIPAEHSATTQKNISNLILANEKKIVEIKKELDENKKRQDIIDRKFTNFEKCPVRYVVTKDDNGTEIQGYKNKNGSNLKDLFNSLNKLTATQDILLHENIVNSAILAQPSNQKRETSINVVNQALADYDPKDSHEAKLCLQAHTLYTQGMRYLYKADNCDMLPQSDFYMKNAVKLLRLHNETVEALNRHRRGGIQKVVVQHVQVNGGQAVVGGMFEGGGVK